MSERRQFRELVPPAVAQETIESLPLSRSVEHVSLAEAHGRVLAERIDAPLDVPGFDRATVDGYAVRAVDTFGANERDPVRLTNIGSVHAGEEPTIGIGEHETCAISTGAVIPDGADAVVMVERSREEGSETILIEHGVAPGANVMAAGTDIGAGHRIARPGTRLSARDIAVLAAIGCAELPVYSTPKVGIISTGDELVRPGEPIDQGRGQIYDVNSHSIAAAVSHVGGEPKLYPHVSDDPDAMRAVLERAARETDLILSSGSTSASTVDVLYDVIEERGELLHHGVAIKPGKPMMIGRFGADESAYIGLPGFPVSALMVFRRFVAPVLAAISGQETATESVGARMRGEERFEEGRTRLLPVGLIDESDGTYVAYPVDKGSGATTSLANADGVVTVPSQTAFVGDGEEITVDLFGIRTAPSVLIIGEEDPLLSDYFDAVSYPRYLPAHSREAQRRFKQNIPDAIVIDRAFKDDELENTLLTWERDWGILVQQGNPQEITGLSDLVELSGSFAAISGTALTDAFENACETAGIPPVEIPGYGLGRPAIESSIRRVQSGESPAGIGLVASAEPSELDVVPVATQRLSLVIAPGRSEKESVGTLTENIDRFESAIVAESGYSLVQ